MFPELGRDGGGSSLELKLKEEAKKFSGRQNLSQGGWG